MKPFQSLVCFAGASLAFLAFSSCSSHSGSQATPASAPAVTPQGSITVPAANVNVQAGQQVAFAATAVDPDGDPVSVLWNFGDGTTSNALAPPSHTYATPGTYTVTMTTTDPNGTADPNPPTRTIVVQAPTAGFQSPAGTITAPAGNVTITAGQSVTFTGTAADPDAEPVTVLWNFGDGASSTVLAPPAHTYATPGVYTVSLTATDSTGLSDPNPPTRTITIQAPVMNGAPAGVITAPAGNVTITAGQSVSFAGTASDPDGDMVTVLWSLGDGTTSTLLTPGSHAYVAAGTYTVTLTATDSQGLPDPNPPTRTITVLPVTANAPPTGVITAPAGNVTITAGQSVSFSGTASDPNGDTVTVLWNFGDGATSTALAPGAHTFAAAGTFTVTFTATDSHGLPDPNPPSRTITVNPAATAATLTQVQTAIFTPSCAGCHSGSGAPAGLVLSAGSAFSNLVNVPATTIPGTRVIPGNSAGSALVIQLTTNGHHTPSAANLTLLKSWIDAGALNN
jgi:PKD repeat protein